LRALPENIGTQSELLLALLGNILMQQSKMPFLVSPVFVGAMRGTNAEDTSATQASCPFGKFIEVLMDLSGNEAAPHV
jgi:hypothetical protein